MQKKRSISQVRKQTNHNHNKYLNSSNIVEGIPVQSTIQSSRPSQIVIQQQSQVFEPIRALNCKKRASQPIQIQPYTKKVNQTNQQEYGVNELRFARRYFCFSLLHFIFFVAQIFIQYYLYGYQLTYAAIITGYLFIIQRYVMLLVAVINARKGSRTSKSSAIFASQIFLGLFIALQIMSFVSAIVYPVRYSQHNSIVNDALNDYNDYYKAQVSEENDDDEIVMRMLVSQAYSMGEICSILKVELGDSFQQKSYAQYCLDIISGKATESSLYNSLQIGILIYHVVGLIAALILTFVLGKMSYRYYLYVGSNGDPESPSNSE